MVDLNLLELDSVLLMQSPLGVMSFEGGETAALARLQDYFWKKANTLTKHFAY